MHKVRTLRRREATERVDFVSLNAVSAGPSNDPKSAKEAARVVLPDVSSLAVMAEADGLGKARRLHTNKADIMKHRLTEGCLGRRAFAEETGARTLRGMSCAPLSPDSQVGRWVRGLAQDVPTDDGAVAQVPMDVVETSRKRDAKQAGHQQNNATRGGEQPDQGSLADAGMHEAMGTQGRLVLMLWRWQKRTHQQGSSDELVLLV